jgi:hypothetical protein
MRKKFKNYWKLISSQKGAGLLMAVVGAALVMGTATTVFQLVESNRNQIAQQESKTRLSYLEDQVRLAMVGQNCMANFDSANLSTPTASITLSQVSNINISLLGVSSLSVTSSNQFRAKVGESFTALQIKSFNLKNCSLVAAVNTTLEQNKRTINCSLEGQVQDTSTSLIQYLSVPIMVYYVTEDNPPSSSSLYTFSNCFEQASGEQALIDSCKAQGGQYSSISSDACMFNYNGKAGTKQDVINRIAADISSMNTKFGNAVKNVSNQACTVTGAPAANCTKWSTCPNIISISGIQICRFTGYSACPANWTQYLNWSTTVSAPNAPYTYTNYQYKDSGCMTGSSLQYMDYIYPDPVSYPNPPAGHAWSNTAVESFTYNSSNSKSSGTCYTSTAYGYTYYDRCTANYQLATSYPNCLACTYAGGCSNSACGGKGQPACSTCTANSGPIYYNCNNRQDITTPTSPITVRNTITEIGCY